MSNLTAGLAAFEAEGSVLDLLFTPKLITRTRSD